MSHEIEKLKSDIAVLERVGRSGGYANGYAVDPLLGQMRYKLEQLEEEAKDPHKEAKELVTVWETYSDQKSDLRKVAIYVKYLMANITRLTHERDKLQKWINETMPRTEIRGGQTNGL